MTQETLAPLALLDKATQLLSQARSLDEIKAVRDKAEAARSYARAAKLSLELQNSAAELKLRAERKAGAFLARLNLRGGDRISNKAGQRLTLEDLGISRNESKRWQLAATVREAEFNKYIEAKQQLGEEITAVGLLRLARQQQRSANGIATANGHPLPGCGDLSQEALDAIAANDSSYLLHEVRNHLGLLDQVLRPVYENSPGELKNGERRAIGHLLRELDAICRQLEKHLI